MGRQAPRPALEAVGEADRGPERRLHHVAELPVEGIARRFQDRDVKGDVRLQRVIIPHLSGLHAGIASGNRGQRIGARRNGCKRRRLRLDRDAQFGKLAQQVQREFPLQQPVQHIGVEQVPRRGRLHDRALPRPCGQQALGGQHLHRLARHGAADAMLLRQLRLGREPAALPYTSDDLTAQRVKHPVGQIAAQTAAHHPPTIAAQAVRHAPPFRLLPLTGISHERGK